MQYKALSPLEKATIARNALYEAERDVASGDPRSGPSAEQIAAVEHRQTLLEEAEQEVQAINQ